MAGFTFRKNLDGSAYVPALLEGVGKDSIVFTVGDVVRINTSGYIDLSTANEAIVGVVQSVVTSKGLPVAPDAGTTDTWTMGASNTTVGLKVQFIPAFGHYAFSADSDTTITIADVGQYFNVKSTSDAIVTSGQSSTIGTLQWQCIGLDPNNDADASMGLYRCVASQVGQSAIITVAA